jgi:hypothetical protein
LFHHAHLCVTSGESVRLAQATSGLGVKALSGDQNPTSTRQRTGGKEAPDAP